MEHIRGGDLYDVMKKSGPYTESQAKVAIHRILQALMALHARKIVHRDLKTENVMLLDRRDRTSVCVIDFGLAATLGSDLMYMRCGSPGYVAPEVLEDKRYGTKCDVFSAGIILFTMLTGKPPFRGEDAKEILGKNARCKIQFRGFPFSNISEEARHLLAWMTQKNPDLRCTSAAALAHPWFTNETLPPGLPTVDNSPACLMRLPQHLMSMKQLDYVTGAMSCRGQDEVMEEQAAPTPPPETNYFEVSGSQIWPFPQTRLCLTRVCRRKAQCQPWGQPCKLLPLPPSLSQMAATSSRSPKRLPSFRMPSSMQGGGDLASQLLIES
eukprot:Blabericola_migrator_1__3096@NODE_18_length_22925_cov_118_464826_g15_i0_p7_GENE_NODE_18_length_22925_cov_118_464826_g15_i0NODE_18_length_22925_cov_118_464826_g15_i0_p7_ORF_typecomplete_len325_score37_69Pkinase/PF00069_25/1_2e48Pkinase_Tyr/PF07714_17/7_6e30Kinaselike/PF14531_6/2_4e16Kdo/PF06293_14/2e11Pkinase_fungal/PF17667_1/1e09APH/PF01636_23/3_5e05APH/PF01636_23/32RIO1/PF01163_22/5_9e05WaaY/PF06176_11/9_9e05EcKinase/PF02958_20/0_005YrbLPhoP_reg/PF10707_9/0_021FTA2/PF13095_6/0_051_NODE_18_lengt